MKTALCLSGQVRNWKNSFDSIYNQIIKKYNCDVFIHSWNAASSKISHDFNQKLFIDEWGDVDYSFIKHYNPKKIKFDWPDYDFYRENFNIKDRTYNTLMMWYSLDQSNKLRKEYELETNISYDCVIRCRMDLFFENFKITELKKSTLYLPPNENINKPWSIEIREMFENNNRHWGYMTNDQFAYGDNNTMDYYCGIFDRAKLDNTSISFHPENYLKLHLLKKRKEIEIVVNDNIKMKIN